MPKCLNWRNILSWNPFGSDLDPNSDNVFKGERISISLKAGHHRPASKTPLNVVSLACRWWPNVECWLGSFENFRRSCLLLRNSIFLWFFRWGVRTPCPPSGSAHGTGLCLHLLRYTENPFYRVHRLCTILCVLSIDRQVERERERERDACSFWISSFLTQRTRLRITKIRVHLCKKFDRRDEWLYNIINGICADGEQAKSVLVFWRKNESEAIHR